MTEPTPAELDVFIETHMPAYWQYGAVEQDRMRSLVRTAIAKWSTPPAVAGEPVAWVDERAISWLENSRAHSATITTTLGKAKSSERPMPLHGTPQPTQAQAGAVPLSDEEVDSLCKVGFVYVIDGKVTRTPTQYRDELKAAQRYGLRKGEHAHGIKGGQHGTE